MKVRVLFFAAYREIVGEAEIEVDLPAGAPALDLIRSLRLRGGRWALLPARPALAINRCYADLDTSLSPDDEIALIPPVAGG